MMDAEKSIRFFVVIMIVLLFILGVVTLPIKTEKVELQYVNSDNDYYYCYIEADDGGLEQVKLNVENTTLYKTLSVGERPYIEQKVAIFSEINESKYAKLYVPENTIIQTTDLSAPR